MNVFFSEPLARSQIEAKKKRTGDEDEQKPERCPASHSVHQLGFHRCRPTVIDRRYS
jgi:hypothetical protein